MEAVLSCAHLTSVVVRIFYGNVSLWISLADEAIVSFSDKSVLELLFGGVKERSNIGSLLLHHFHGDLNWLHDLTVLDVHPFDLSWNFADFELGCLVVLKYPFFLHVVNWVPDGEAHLILLPDVVVVDDLDSRNRGGIVHLDQLITCYVCAHHAAFLILNIGHQLKISQSVDTFLPIDLSGALILQE